MAVLKDEQFGGLGEQPIDLVAVLAQSSNSHGTRKAGAGLGVVGKDSGPVGRRRRCLDQVCFSLRWLLTCGPGGRLKA
jgi:hypothetical protein